MLYVEVSLVVGMAEDVVMRYPSVMVSACMSARVMSR